MPFFLKFIREKNYKHIAGRTFMSIPKIIHYCWLSRDQIPEPYQSYINLWKIKLPGYQFILWNTERFDLNKTVWTKQAFDVNLYACAADYIRLYAVYNYGGIYLDTDMEVIKPFDGLLNEEIMLGYENHKNGNLEAGCFGAVKGHPYIRKCMEYFENNQFFDPDEEGKIKSMPVSERHEYIDPLILPEIMKRVLKEHFENEGYRIYPRECFTAKNIATGVIEKKDITCTVHHFGTRYHSEEWRRQRERRQKINRIFGEHSIMGKVIDKAYTAAGRIEREGIRKAVKYYINKYTSGKDGGRKNGI
jgi:hypothetical protein